LFAGHATRVPQAAVTSGTWRSATVTPRRPLGWAPRGVRPTAPFLRSVLGPQPTGKQRTTVDRSGHRRLIETAGRHAYSLLTSGGAERRRGVRVSPTRLPRALRLLATIRWSPKTGLTFWLRWQPSLPAAERRRSRRPCHPRAITADTSGIQRTTTVTPRRPLAGLPPLTCGERGGRNCMACKGSTLWRIVLDITRQLCPPAQRCPSRPSILRFGVQEVEAV
jgi:hypothetical protein